MATPTNPIERLDVTQTVVEAEAHLLGLLAHPVPESAPLMERHDWVASVFRDLATTHPEACTSDATYPGWAAERLAEQIAKSDSTRTRGGAS